jgi:hypothetical protein
MNSDSLFFLISKNQKGPNLTDSLFFLIILMSKISNYSNYYFWLWLGGKWYKEKECLFIISFSSLKCNTIDTIQLWRSEAILMGGYV